ncbi:hypothetical protein D3C76_1488240 [compost metagenome]
MIFANLVQLRHIFIGARIFVEIVLNNIAVCIALHHRPTVPRIGDASGNNGAVAVTLVLLGALEYHRYAAHREDKGQRVLQFFDASSRFGQEPVTVVVVDERYHMIGVAVIV